MQYSAQVIGIYLVNNIMAPPGSANVFRSHRRIINRMSVEGLFEWVRVQASLGQTVIVREDGQCLLLPALRKDAVKPEMVATVERMISPTRKQNVAVIGDTTWAMNDSPSLSTTGQAIPFFGFLMGFTYIGHSVWVFNGALLAAGCRHADVLIVDSELVPGLRPDWEAEARRVMRNPQIMMHDRATYKLYEFTSKPN